MDDVITRPQSKISAAEMERRRKAVRMADASNRLEGLFRHPDTDAVVESFIRGDIEMHEMTARLKAQLAP